MSEAADAGRSAVRVAASTAAADLLAVPLHVVAVGRWAAYCVAPGRSTVGRVRPAAGRVLAVVAAGAWRPASSVVLPPGTSPLDVVRPGEDVVLARRMRVARWQEPPALPTGRPDPRAVAVAADLVAAARVEAGVAPSDAEGADRARAAGAAAARALLRGDGDAAGEALVAVLGLGPGTTPTGDDVAAGVLLAGRGLATAPGADPRVVAAVEVAAFAVMAAAPLRTTTVSAGLLADSARGQTADVVVEALAALLGRRPVEPAVARLLRVGCTSGADLASGLLAVASAASAPPEPRTRRCADAAEGLAA